MATATASRALAKKPVAVIPPASPFAELLRRSRFASFDPEIQQTYSAPPAYASRGNWGLKRPISQRRKDTYITLKSYEDHAQYIEWNNAEPQVRFVKRFEELNITPDLGDTTRWVKNLGPSRAGTWLVDSEFDSAKEVEYRYFVEDAISERSEADTVVHLNTLGKKGKGSYGANAPIEPKDPLIPQSNKGRSWNFRQPNIAAMSPQEFTRYLDEVRALRPQFLATARRTLKERAASGESTMESGLDPNMSDMQLALVNHRNNDHSAFLNNYFEEKFASRDTEPSAADPVEGNSLPRDFVKHKIKPQPHRFGGLTYSHPSILDTRFSTAPKPAHVLHSVRDAEATKGTFSSRSQAVKVSFGGVVAELQKPRAELKGIFSHSVNPSGQSDDFAVNVRVKNFVLKGVPCTTDPNRQGLEGATFEEVVVEDIPMQISHWDNGNKPGTYAYTSAEPVGLKPPPFHWGLGTKQKGSHGKRGKPAVAQKKLMNKLVGMTRQ